MAKAANFIATPVASLPHVSIDGGVYHVDGRLVRMDQTSAELWEQARVMMAVALHVEATK